MNEQKALVPYQPYHPIYPAPLDRFAEIYEQKPIPSHIYQEAILVWLSQRDEITPENLVRFGVPQSALDRMERFFMRPERFRNTYWFYYLKAMNEEQ